MMDGVPIRKLLVRNFANRTTSKDIRNYFSKYGNVEKCYLRGNRGKSNCAFVTFTNVADAERAMQDGSRKRIHNRDLRVMAAALRLQPGGMEQRLYNMGKESSKETNKASERRIANQQYSHNHLHNDTESVSIDMLNDDCLTHIFQYLEIVDRVRIEMVCKRWRDLSQVSWHMLKTLDLSSSMWATWGFSYTKNHTDLLHKILPKYGKFLTHIDLSRRYHNLSQSTLNIIGEHCSNLTSIDVTKLRVCPSSIHTLANNCRNITKFSLGPSTYSCDNELRYFFMLNQKLEYLEISGSNILGESLLCLPEQTMHTIILYSCNNLRDNHLSMALKRLKNLKNLEIYICRGITERTLEVVGQHCKNLRALKLGTFPPITDMSYLFHLVDLQIFKLNNQVSDDFLADLVKHCQQLTNLDIAGCDEVSDVGLAAVARLVKLEKLIVNGIDRITDDGLKNMCGLRELECRGCHFTDRGMSTFIKSSPQLQFLDLILCTNITNTTLEAAKQACSNRTNNVMLKMKVAGTSVTKKNIDQKSLPPLLHIRWIL